LPLFNSVPTLVLPMLAFQLSAYAVRCWYKLLLFNLIPILVIQTGTFQLNLFMVMVQTGAFYSSLCWCY